jgi:hypothetical protein
MTSLTPSQLGNLSWRKRRKRKIVPRNGGRPRIYPPCPRYSAHRFAKSFVQISETVKELRERCPCGYVRVISR